MASNASLEQSRAAENTETDDFEAQWQQALSVAPPVKSSCTRLLDLLAGWGTQASHDAFPDSTEARARIADLYQEAGQFAFDEIDEEERNARIREFLPTQVLPTLTM